MKAPLIATGFGLIVLSTALLVHSFFWSDEQALQVRVARLLAEMEMDPQLSQTDELLTIGQPALEPVEKAIRDTNNPQLQRELRRIMPRLAIRRQGGEVVNGLKICLNSDRYAVSSGQKMRFVTTLCNMSERPLIIKIGVHSPMRYDWLAFQTGEALRRVVHDRHDPSAMKELAREEPRWPIPPSHQETYIVVGTGKEPGIHTRTVPACPVVTVLPPMTAKEYITEADFFIDDTGKSAFYMDLIDGHFRRFHNQALIAPQGEVCRLRLVHSATPIDDDSWLRGADDSSFIKPDDNSPYWTGSIRSNDVFIAILPKR